MIATIGMMEFNSIARGIETTDTMLKAASTQLVFSKPVCPGKYFTMISGDVGAVKESISAGESIGRNFIISKIVIPSVHSQLIPAINAVVEIEQVAALGVVEYFDILSAVLGADAAAKAANIKLMEVRLGMGIAGKSFITLCGDVSDVKSAVKAAEADAIDKGCIVSSCVIPSPVEALFREML